MGEWKLRSKIYKWFRRVYPINQMYKKEMRNIRNLVAQISAPPQLVLDLGTGIGDSLPQLPEGNRRFLFDFSHDMLDKVHPTKADQKIIGNILNLPFKSNSFDLITCIGVSEYIPYKTLLLKEIFDCLKSDGYAIITFSPPGLKTTLRKCLGKMIYPLSGSTAYDLIAARGFFVVCAYRSSIQSQYLIKKIEMKQ